MRFPASKVYRAFPELDRFTDEQCEGFLKAARKGVVRTTARWGAQLLAAVSSTGAVTAAIRYASEGLRVGPLSFGSEAGWVVAGVSLLLIALSAGGLSWLMVKDWLLRRRIRRVINTRGSCAACGYVLAGLPVTDGLKVRCPECAFEVVADPSLGEVATDSAGSQRFLPSPDVVPALVRWLTPRRKRLIRRTALWGMAALVFCGAVSWVGYEWFLRRQAGAALSARTGMAPLVEFIEKHQPAGTTPDSPDAWDAYTEAMALMGRADIRVTRESGVEYPAEVRPEYCFEYVYLPDSSFGEGAEVAPVAAQNRELAGRLVEAYREVGVLTMFDEMALRPRAVRRLVDPGPGRPLVQVNVPELSGVRAVARMNSARMTLAMERGDVAEFASAFEATLATVRMLNASPVLIDRLVSMAVEALIMERAKVCLAGRPDAPWIEAIGAAIERQRSAVPLADVVRADKAATLDSLAWLFSDPGRVRGGGFSPGVRSLTFGWNRLPDKPLGTFQQNLGAFEARFDTTIRLVETEPFERAGVLSSPEPNLLLLDVFGSVGAQLVRISDRERLSERGMRLLLALGLFRCAHGDYPERLEELVPSALSVMPLDPFSGKPFCYRRVPAEGGKGSFLLYSVGADGVDNGGAGAKYGNEALSPGYAGYDFVIGPGGTDYSR